MSAIRIPALITLEVVAIVIGVCCIGCSAYGFHYDTQWNAKVENPKTNLTEQTVDQLIRKSKNAKAFIGIVTCLWFGSWAYLFIYLFCYRSSTVWSTFNVIMNGGAGLLLIIYGALYMNSTIRMNENYATIEAADSHNFTDYFFCDVRNFQYFLELDDEYKDILESEMVCQRWGYKYIAASLALCNAIIYAVIAWMEFWLNHKTARKLSDSEQRESMVSGTTPTATPVIDGFRESGVENE